MHCKPVVRYLMAANLRFFRNVYAFVYGFTALSSILSLVRTDMRTNIGGLEIVTMICIFIAASMAVREALRFFVSSGVTRRSFRTGALIAFSVTALGAAALDTVNAAVFRFLPRENFMSIFDAAFAAAHGGTPDSLTAAYLLQGFLWRFLVYLPLAFFGLFFRSLLLRLNSRQRHKVAAGLPVFLFVVLPGVNSSFGLHFGTALRIVFAWWVGLGAKPLANTAFALILCAGFACALSLSLRRIEIRD